MERFRHIPHLGQDEVLRNRYLVCYDIHDPQRLMQIHKKMKGYGEPIQYSVFMCELSYKEIIIMREELEDIINMVEDKILIINLGSLNKSKEKILVIGVQVDTEKETSVVI